MKINVFLFSSILLLGCASSHKTATFPDEKQNWIIAYKNSVFISILKAHDSTIMHNDASESPIADYLQDYNKIRNADSLGKAVYETIKPSPVQDLNYKKMVVNEALYYYTSKTLDSIARSEYASFKKRQNQIQ